VAINTQETSSSTQHASLMDMGYKGYATLQRKGRFYLMEKTAEDKVDG
jgi:hypothetical protein